MAPTNIELTLQAYEVFNRRDLDALLALFDEEIEIESRIVAMEGAFRGHEGARSWYDAFLEAFPDYTVEPGELRELGDDMTICHVRGVGHGAGSGMPMIDPFWHVARWRDGKMVWWRNCATEADALEAAGLQT
jgi:ketosteroid isomerase-like protein